MEKPTKITALGRLFDAMGVPDWEEVFPTRICGKCCLQPQCTKDQSCVALNVIGAMGAVAVNHPLKARNFATDLKHVLNSIHKH